MANRLAGESSAYLRQHMHNPVDWHPWGEAALARARAEQRPLLVSIGYSACHWCHVMERESFEDEQTAALMNQHFICIKVDREERPDVDRLYMDALLRLQGHGGWPLTAFCRPDGSPFHAGTYYPPEPRHGLPSFRQVLEAVQRAFHEQRERVDHTAQQLLRVLAERPRGAATGTPACELLVSAARALMQGADRAHGGFGAAPKFPTPTQLEVLLAVQELASPVATAARLPEAEARDALNHLLLTCQEMSRRGCYDQLGGGFHRYCVDAHWGVPHFEKMLYDQGQLLRIYAELWRRRGGEELLWPVRETAAWLRREMCGAEGGLYASQDADSEGEEGRFYVWTPADVQAVLGEKRSDAFCSAYAVTHGGNFEGRSVLWDLARGPRGNFAAERAELFAARARRAPPDTDTKCLLGWNALAVSGLAHAGSVTGDGELLRFALRVANFARERLRGENGRWFRVFAEGRAKVPAFLDDLAAWLAACLDLQRAGAGLHWLDLALEVAGEICQRFFDPAEGDFFLTAGDDDTLPHRPRGEPDGATPDAGALAVLGLLRAAAISGRTELRNTAEQVLATHAAALQRAPGAFATLLRAAVWAERGLATAIIVGAEDDSQAQALATRARQLLAPEEAVLLVPPGAQPAAVDAELLAGRTLRDGRPAAYLCRGASCSAPVTQPAELGAALSEAP